MQFDKEFKEAVVHLPTKEKDKLLLRLLKKDPDLANRLFFELIDERTVGQRREELEAHVMFKVEQFSNPYWQITDLKRDMSYVSGDIAYHVKITKDKFGEVSLNILLLLETLKNNNEKIIKNTLGKAHKVCVYIISKAFRILININKLHEDYRIDFEDDLITLGKYIGANENLMKTAIHNGFDVNWLLRTEIPEDIAEIHKEIRSQGLLR